MLSWLEIARGGDEMVIGKIRIDVYLRLRQVLLWCVASSSSCLNVEELKRQAEEVIDSYLPSGRKVVRFIKNYVDGVPLELDGFLKSPKKVDVCVLQQACFLRNLEKDFLHLLDLHLLHPVILVKILCPLKVFSSQCILTALADDVCILNGVHIEKSGTLSWLLGRGFNRCSDETAVENLGLEKGDAVALTPMIISNEVDCTYRWDFILDHSMSQDYEPDLDHGWEYNYEVGFVKGEERWTSLGFPPHGIEVSNKSLYSVQAREFSRYTTTRLQDARIKIRFSLHTLLAKGSVCSSEDHSKTIRSWNNLPEGIYYPYIRFHPLDDRDRELPAPKKAKVIHSADDRVVKLPPSKNAQVIQSIITRPDIHSKIGIWSQPITKVHVNLVKGFDAKWI
ncbi:hypothetical protein R1flu_028884 [Riccia fluitans]|uniref:Uncharacterized protein n=1 Tax=Riccia fluitans TaxID=41844 RepID=A0ABD1XMZ5_9MARC